jgi:heme/copper-type cytochrome/quinol oxidase subunit 4
MDVLRGAEYLGAQIAQNGQVGTAMVGLLPRIAVYALAFWLYLRGSLWGAAPAILMATMRLIFSFEVAASVLMGQASSSIENHLVNIMALLFAAATLVTAIWAAVDLRRSGSIS